MKLTNKFFKDHNISRSHFSNIVGVSPKTLAKIECGIDVKNEVKAKVDIAIKVMNDLALVYPDIHYVPNEKDIKVYTKNKKKSNSMDKKFATAFKKAMK